MDKVGGGAGGKEAWLFITVAAVSFALFYAWRSGWLGVQTPEHPGWFAVVCGAWTLGALYLWIQLAFGIRLRNLLFEEFSRPPDSPEAFAATALTAPPADADARQLYIDMVKRVVSNVIYEDAPFWFYTPGAARIAAGYDLRRRAMGEDLPSVAHTMIGLRRLDNLHRCIETILTEKVPGDLIETGSYCGGAAIFMRAVLRAHAAVDRRVFACDAYQEPAPAPPTLLLHVFAPLLKALAAIPGRRFRRAFYPYIMKALHMDGKFPVDEHAGDDFIDFMFWAVRNVDSMLPDKKAGLAHVRANFARYGLLDEQTVFLKGFFADTLPQLRDERFALVRLDGDAYESTRTGLTELYPRLERGGFLIVDDFNSFAECKRAVLEYRAERGISEPIIPIDSLSVYWRKDS